MSFYELLWRAYHAAPAPLRAAIARSPLGSLKRAAGVRGNHDKMYNPAYFAELDATSRPSAIFIARSIARDVHPSRVMDVGCGSGALLLALRELGTMGDGVEYSSAGLAMCRQRGLRVQRFDLENSALPRLSPPYNLVISMEVAEHLPEILADRFVAFLAALGDRVAFTAATPGQGGIDHVNEQPHSYWIEKFAAHGFVLDTATAARWSAEWEAEGAAPWYHRNIMYFVRGVAPLECVAGGPENN